MRRGGMLWLALSILLLAAVLTGVVRAGSGGGRATAGVLTAPPRGALPGRDASSAVDLAGWRVVGVVVEDASGGRHVFPLENPTQAPELTATNTPAMTPTATHTPRPTNTATPSPSSTPTATGEPPTPTPEDACMVRSTANVWARTLPIVRSDTRIGVLPADSPVRITGYYLEHTGDANTSHIWYRYWFDVDHPEAWSRADFFTERDTSPGCQLMPRVTEP